MPFEDASFDAVVITLVLCTVEDVSAVLREVLRVLRPGGKLHFLEHVASPDPRVRKWQDRLNGIWRVVGCGYAT
jgi:ubiquinone/menaquinone biosynthesis C-methylase UbiE